MPVTSTVSLMNMGMTNIEQRDEYQKLIYAQVTSYDPDVWFPNGVLAANVRGNRLIKTWREYCKLTKAELADKAGMKQSSLARLEKSATSPGKSTSTKLVKAMGIGIEQLID